MGRGSVTVRFVALAVTWGASFLFIKVGLEGLSPAQVVLARLGFGALALGGWCVVRREPLPASRSTWAHLAVVSALLCLAPFMLYAWAEQHVASALASIVNAMTPLMTTLVGLVALPEERPTRARILGLALGFAGVLLVLAPWRGIAVGEVAGPLACLAATACYGCAFVYLRRFVAPLGLPPLPVATVQVGLSAVVMLGLAPLVATATPHLTPAVVASMLALGVLGTGVAYVWNTQIVSAWGATRPATVTYIAPVVGVVLGVLVLGEPLAWYEPVGAAVVIAGVVASRR